MKLKSGFLPLALALTVSTASYGAQKNESEKVIDIVNKVNQHWQENNKAESSSFWHNAAYHTGNMEAYFLTGNEAYRAYSEAWAEHKAHQLDDLRCTLRQQAAERVTSPEWRDLAGEGPRYQEIVAMLEA